MVAGGAPILVVKWMPLSNVSGEKVLTALIPRLASCSQLLEIRPGGFVPEIDFKEPGTGHGRRSSTSGSGTHVLGLHQWEESNDDLAVQ